MEKEILFIGFLMSSKKMDLVKKKEKDLMHYAANKFQWNIINYLSENKNINSIRTITNTFLSCYPKYPKIFFGKESEDIDKTKICYIPFINLRILKSITISFSTLFYSLAWLFRNRSKDKVIITYAMYSPFILVNYFLKKITNTPNIIVVLDLPEYMNLTTEKQSFLTKVFQKINIKIAWKLIDKFDGYVLLTEHMAKKLEIEDKPYAIVEGFAVNNIEKRDILVKEDNKRIVMYAGSLNEKYGVKNLVESFEQIDNDNYELWLCGNGDCVEFIKNISKFDTRIKYYGILPNEEVLKLEKLSNMLINPRPTNQEFTKYSFPSKNMEYLSTGVPVITTRLPGMPEEYNEYVFFLDDETPKGIAKVIEDVGSYSNKHLNEFGEKARLFVLENKNYRKQGEKIFNLMNKL